MLITHGHTDRIFLSVYFSDDENCLLLKALFTSQGGDN
jgi:hypothetical protein